MQNNFKKQKDRFINEKVKLNPPNKKTSDKRFLQKIINDIIVKNCRAEKDNSSFDFT